MRIQLRHTPSGQAPEAYWASLSQKAFSVQAELLGESMIVEIWMNESVKKAISEWVEESLRTIPVKEVGGFLTGYYRKTERERYALGIENFLAARQVDFSSPIALVFGDAVLDELLALLDRHPSSVLLGWFHTHPGHGPFLSQTDLRTHEGFFRKAYQIALVLDSLNEHWTTGWFSRKPDFQMNNNEDISYWMAWKSKELIENEGFGHNK